MSTFYGTQSLEFLSDQIYSSDPSSSSHWDKYHHDFAFDGSGFKGLKGFGDFSNPNPLFKSLYRFLNYRYSRLGKNYKGYDQYYFLARQIAHAQNRYISHDILRQVLTISFLDYHLSDLLKTPLGSTCVIGDGFATMTSLLIGSKFTNKVYLVNLTKTLLVDLFYLRLFFGTEFFEENVCLLTGNDDYTANDISGIKCKIVAIQAKDSQLLSIIDSSLFINIASMQEMSESVVHDYFRYMRSSLALKDVLYFYCCNREAKVLPDGTVSSFAAYPWGSMDFDVVNELCPWHLTYPSLVPPFYRQFDGLHRHKLTQIS